MPIEERPWNVGLIVGPSGCGKSTVARKAFGDRLIAGYEWDHNKAIVSQFEDLSIKDVAACLSSVGFSSPPSWLRPFHALSNGEQFRVTLARAIACEKELFAIDEFTSVVDRTVAKIGSCAVAKSVRASNKQLVAVACHYDIIEWLQPDWTYEPASDTFEWRSLRRRPDIEVEVSRVKTDAWELFKKNHYLSATINKSAGCFMATIEGRPAAFSSAISFPHPKTPGWREHRTVCLPDFQGVGIGNMLSEYVASLYVATGKPFTSTTSSKSMIYSRAKSPNWKMTRDKSLLTGHKDAQMKKSSSVGRRTFGFKYVGPANPEDAAQFGIGPVCRRLGPA